MSVDAIQQVIEAEQKAEMLLQETTALIEEKEKRSQEAIEAFHDTLRVQEKLGFVYQYLLEDVHFPLIDEVRTERVSLLTREEWYSRKENP